MKHFEHHIAFGPVPSRRLGWSLGVNNIPLFRVRLGTLKGNLALQVLKNIERPK